MAVLKKIQKVLTAWKFRNLSLFGKITIFKTFAISAILYVSHMSSVSCEILESLNQIHCDFVWDGKKGKLNILPLLVTTCKAA